MNNYKLACKCRKANVENETDRLIKSLLMSGVTLDDANAQKVILLWAGNRPGETLWSTSRPHQAANARASVVIGVVQPYL